jgi:hypothetical protein
MVEGAEYFSSNTGNSISFSRTFVMKLTDHVHAGKNSTHREFSKNTEIRTSETKSKLIHTGSLMKLLAIVSTGDKRVVCSNRLLRPAQVRHIFVRQD